MVKKKFVGELAFLSNFHPSPIIIPEWEMEYATGEHLYQSLKTEDMKWAIAIAEAKTPGQCKRLAQECPLRENWEEVKLGAMYFTLQRKFPIELPNRFTLQLLQTPDEDLVEINPWKDTFWGVDYRTGEGQNWLGRLLLIHRDKLRERIT